MFLFPLVLFALDYQESVSGSTLDVMQFWQCAEGALLKSLQEKEATLTTVVLNADGSDKFAEIPL